MECWVEENIKPNTPDDMDVVLFNHVRPIVDQLKQQNWLISWHFFRESENWRGRGKQPPLVQHIRFRVRTTETELQNVRDHVKKKLDTIQNNGRIADHYRGNEGTPNDDYCGESAKFDETATNPRGWSVVQDWLQSGSEIEMILLDNRFQGTRLGSRFKLPDLLHFFANQCGRYHDWTTNGKFMIFQM